MKEEAVVSAHPVSDAMRAVVLENLAAIERQHDVTVLFACESGSRGWGFASPDSDYDVRFIYVNRLSWYLTVEPGRDVIELPISGELDINGFPSAARGRGAGTPTGLTAARAALGRGPHEPCGSPMAHCLSWGPDSRFGREAYASLRVPPRLGAARPIRPILGLGGPCRLRPPGMARLLHSARRWTR